MSSRPFTYICTHRARVVCCSTLHKLLLLIPIIVHVLAFYACLKRPSVGRCETGQKDPSSKTEHVFQAEQCQQQDNVEEDENGFVSIDFITKKKLGLYVIAEISV